jgi:hypothetical protein
MPRLQLKQDRHIVKESVKYRNLRLYIQAARWSRGMILALGATTSEDDRLILFLIC